MQVTKMSIRETRTYWRDMLDTVDKGDADIIIERYGHLLPH